MTKYFLILTFIICSPFLAIADEESDKAEFNKLYAEFNDLYTNSKEIDPIIEVAEKLYKLAPRIYGKSSQNYAVVTYNLATLYDEKSKDWAFSNKEKASDLYKEYFKILTKNKSPINDQYLDHYMAFVNIERSINNVKLKSKYLNALISLSTSKHVSEIKRAEVENFVATQHYIKGDEKKALKLFVQSKERYISTIGEDNLMVANVAINEALIYFNNKEYQEAQFTFLQAIKIYENLISVDKNLLANAHKNLARLYVETEKYDLAAYHGEKVVEFANDPRDMLLPIVRATPHYPGIARRSRINGLVLLEYSIDKEGRTKDIVVTYSSSSLFEESAIKAVEKFRYIPLMKEGEIVEINNVKTEMNFNIGNRKSMTIQAIK